MNLKQGMKVKTCLMLGSTKGMFVHQKHIYARRANTMGTLLQWVPGHGGDVWAVEHEDKSIATYCVTEFCVLEEAEGNDS